MNLAYAASAEPERFHPRVPADLEVKVLSSGDVRRTRARDVSMAGLKLSGRAGPIGGRLTLAVVLPKDREILTHATITRLDDGTAVEFDQLDWEDLIALARFLHPRLP